MHAPRKYEIGRSTAIGLGLAIVMLLAAAGARADGASGTWSGELEGRGNYYYERSTKVMVPTGRLTLVTPTDVRMHVEYLADVISTASVAARSDNKDNVFTEVRHGIGTGVGKLLPVGQSDELDLSFRGIYSTESDYISWIFAGRAAYGFNQKSSTLSLGVTGVHDTIYRNMGEQGVHDPDFGAKHLNGVTTSLGFSQILTPVLTLGLGYQLVYLTGFQSNPYRRALVGPLPHPEEVPNKRWRHNLEAQLSWYLPPTSTTLQAFARVYTDSWDVQAITPELRIYQMLGRDWVLRLRLRYYLQGRAEFAPEDGAMAYPRGSTGYLTNDPKLRGFHSEQVGLRIEYALNALAGGPLGFLSRGLLDVSLDHQWNDSAFNNPHVLIGTLGGRLPF